jgi:hypothetical protein
MRRTSTWILFSTLLTRFIIFVNIIGSHPRRIYLVMGNLASTTLINIASGQTGSNDNTTLNVALIGLVGAIIGAVAVILAGVITGWLPFHLQQKSSRKEQERERKELDAESARVAMATAKTLRARTSAYRNAIWVDPRISTIQILDMNQPLDITSIYVQLRIHRDITPRY